MRAVRVLARHMVVAFGLAVTAVGALAAPASAADPASITIIATSDATTPPAVGTVGDPVPMAIGEQVTFRLKLQVPESTSIVYTARVTLPAELDYVGGSASVSYQANLQPSMDGDFVGISNSSTPTFAFPAGRIAFDSGTGTLSFDFGSIINNDGDGDEEWLIIDITAVMSDQLATNSGDTMSVDLALVIDEGFPTELIQSAASVHLEVVEPSLDATALFSPAEVARGGSSTFTIDVTNLATDGATGPLHDIAVAETFDDWLHVTAVNVTFNGAATTFGSTFTDNSTITLGFATGVQDELSVSVSGLPVDGTVSVVVSLATDPAASPASLPRTITSTVDIAADSLGSGVSPSSEQRSHTDTAADNLTVFRAPLAEVATTTDSPTNDTTIPFTVTFDEDVTGLDVSDLTLVAPAGSNFANFVAVDARTYTVDVTGMTADGDIGVLVGAGAATNSDGRTNPESEPAVVTYDGTAPTITGPAEGSTIETTTDPGQAGAIVEFEVIGANLGCAPNSGALFVIGTNVVTCTAEDDAGNVTVRTFAIEVTDAEAPTIGDLPDRQLLLATGATTATVTFAPPAATDNSGSVQVACVAPSGTALPAGTHTITCTATDTAGNTATSSFVVTISRAPTIPATGSNTQRGLQLAALLLVAGAALLATTTIRRRRTA